MNRIKAVLFDLDGTLMDSMPAHFEAWNLALKDHNVVLDYQELCLSEGADCYKIINEIFESRNRPIDPQIIDVIAELKTKYYVQRPRPKLFDYVNEILALLQTNKVSLALVTGGSLENIRHSLESSVLERFKVIIKAGDTERGKPYPDPYIEALRQLKIEPQDAIVVENAPYGIKAAKLAGIMCIAVSTTLHPNYLSEADIVLKSHEELLSFFKKSF